MRRDVVWLAVAVGSSTGCADARDARSLDATVAMPDAAGSDAGASACTKALPSWPRGVEDQHCRTDSERLLRQRVGACVPGSGTVPDAPLLLNGRGPDADCKYDLELLNADCRTTLRVRADMQPVDGARARVQLRDAQGQLVFEALATPTTPGDYAFELPAQDGVLQVALFEQCAYTDEASPRASAAFQVSR